MSYLPVPIVSGFAVPVSLGGAVTPVTLDLAAFPQLYTATITGSSVISGSNYSPGRAATLRLMASGAACNLAWAPWRFLTSTAPTSIAANKVGVLTIQSFTTVDSGVIAAWAVEP